MEYQNILNAPREFWERYKTNSLISCNGCGGAFRVPEHFPGNPPLKIKICCLIHDYEYQHAAGSWEAKAYCDANFYSNLICLIESDHRCWFVTMLLRKSLAWFYFKAVVVFGASAFWEGKNQALRDTSSQ